MMSAIQMTPRATMVTGVLLAGWVLMALHTSLTMRRYRRRWWVWLLISIFCSVIPAVIVSYIEYFRRLRRADRERLAGRKRVQCPHCGAILDGSDLPGAQAGAGHCPRCNGIIDDSRLA